MIDFVCGRATVDEVIQCFDDNQKAITDDEVTVYTTATENIPMEDCARAISGMST